MTWFHYKVSKGDEKLALPYTRNGVRVVSSRLDLFLEIPQLGVIVTFGATGFSINLPFQHFGNNTQGHCGKLAKKDLYKICKYKELTLV